jgi:Spy/CpxP family protein refolding chaperone
MDMCFDFIEISENGYLKLKVMKTKVLMFVVLMSMSAVLVAQPADKSGMNPIRRDHSLLMNDGQNGPAKGLNLTDAQKEAFKKGMLDLQKQLQPLRNELGEAKAHQKTLMTAEKPDLNAINKNIEKIGALKVEMEKIQAKNRLDMRAQLTDEQRLKFDLWKGKKMQERRARGMRGGMRMQHGMGMPEGHPVN